MRPHAALSLSVAPWGTRWLTGDKNTQRERGGRGEERRRKEKGERRERERGWQRGWWLRT